MGFILYLYFYLDNAFLPLLVDAHPELLSLKKEGATNEEINIGIQK